MTVTNSRLAFNQRQSILGNPPLHALEGGRRVNRCQVNSFTGIFLEH
jgi:hypothetical protein